MKRYAEKTMVSAEKSRNEIEKILVRYGALGFVYGWQDDKAVIGFQMNNRNIKFILPMPLKNDPEFLFTPTRRNKRSAEEIHIVWEQATRQRWRALSLAIKAKLEAVESQITEFENEFLAHIVLPNGKTAGDWMVPQIQSIYEHNQMPKLLTGET